MRRNNSESLNKLQAQAEQAAQQSGKTPEQEFAALLRQNPDAYVAYLKANPVQSGW